MNNSLLATKLLQLHRAEIDGIDEIDAFHGGSECYAFVLKRTKSALRSLIEEIRNTGGNPLRMILSIIGATTHKFQYYSGLGMMCDMALEMIGEEYVE